MYKLLLGIRYFRKRFLALASILAITMSVAALLVVLSVMGGYLVALGEIIRGQASHLQVEGRLGQFGVTNLPRLRKAIESVENVKGTAAFIERLAVYRSGLFLNACRLRGVNPRREVDVSDFGRYVLRPAELESVMERLLPDDGSAPTEAEIAAASREIHRLTRSPGRAPLSADELEALFDKKWRLEVLGRRHPELVDPDKVPAGALVGSRLLLDGRLRLGQLIHVITLLPDGAPRDGAPRDSATVEGGDRGVIEDSDPGGDPKGGGTVEQAFVVVGALKTGEFAVDSGAIHVHLNRLKNLLRLYDPEKNGYRYQRIRVSLENPARLEETRREVGRAIDSIAPQLEVQTWKEERRNFLKAVLIEKFLVYFIVLILVVFTGVMILLMFLLTVIEKTRDIGVLMALGGTSGGITSIFLWSGLLISAVGIGLGLGAGFVFLSNINEIHDAIYEATGMRLFPAEIYQIDRIPVAYQPYDIVLAVVPPIVVGLLASVIAGFWASRRDPIKAIQYE